MDRERATPVTIAMPVAVDMGDIADLAALNAFNRGANPRSIAILMSHLKDLLAGIGSLHDVIVLRDGEGHRLLAVHMTPALERRDNMLRVETQRRGNDDRIEILAIKQRPIVGVGRHVVAAQLVDLLEPRLIHVSGRDDGHTRNPQKVAEQLLPSAAWPDDPKANRLGCAAGRIGKYGLCYRAH